MDFFDNALEKAKEVFDVARTKTTEVVSTQKQKFDVVSIENKRSKDFEQLGKLYFELVKNEDIENEQIAVMVEAIKEKNKKIEELKEEINSAKNKRICPACNAVIDENAVFCSVCGVKLNIESDENE